MPWFKLYDSTRIFNLPSASSIFQVIVDLLATQAARFVVFSGDNSKNFQRPKLNNAKIM
jgi:hypothetical protein